MQTVYFSSCKVPVILVKFQWNLIVSTDLKKNIQISNFMKIRRMGSEWFRSDGRTDGQRDVTKLIVAFHTFANAPKNWSALNKF